MGLDHYKKAIEKIKREIRRQKGIGKYLERVVMLEKVEYILKGKENEL
jgi:hypothetical protein